MEDVIIVGAGPCGLSAAAELKRIGFDPLIVEKGAIVNSIYNYPTFLQFHSTPELLEIAGIPFITPHAKPTRQEGLTYYRTAAERMGLRIHTYETVLSVVKKADVFEWETEDRFGRKKTYRSRYAVISTGYFDQPNWMGIPGEDLPKVSHYYKEAHPFAGLKVAIAGGSNSAVDAALDLAQVGAEATVVYRKGSMSPQVKAWTRPLFESAVEKGRIAMMWGSRLAEIREDSVLIETPEGIVEIANDYVLALTGYRPDRRLLTAAGAFTEEETGVPRFDPETMETNVPGLYVAGVIAAGNEANAIFIETGRFHGKAIAAHLAGKR